MLAAFGEVALLGHFMKLDVIGVAAGAMTGLAIGVGFGLLILDRFHREQRADGGVPRDDATAAMRRPADDRQGSPRSAAAGLVLALGLVAIIGPMELMVSVGTAATTAAMFAIGGAVVVMPAALVLFGRRIDMLELPRADGSLVRHVVGAGRRRQLGHPSCDLRRIRGNRAARCNRLPGGFAALRTAVVKTASRPTPRPGSRSRRSRV